MPSRKWWNPVCGWRIKKWKSSSMPPTYWMHHLASWSQNHLCQWWSGSGVRKSEGLASSQSHQNGQWTPLRLNHFASGRNKLKSQGLTVASISISCARVVDTVQSLCWKALPNCLYVAMVIGDALGLMPAYIRASGVSIMATASGVKQYWHQPRGSNIMIPISVAIFKGSMMKLMHLWMRWFLRTPCILLFLWRNFGTGRMVRSMNAWWDDFIQKPTTMSARLIRRGWVMRFPVTAEILEGFKVHDSEMILRSNSDVILKSKINLRIVGKAESVRIAQVTLESLLHSESWFWEHTCLRISPF